MDVLRRRDGLGRAGRRFGECQARAKDDISSVERVNKCREEDTAASYKTRQKIEEAVEIVQVNNKTFGRNVSIRVILVDCAISMGYRASSVPIGTDDALDTSRVRWDMVLTGSRPSNGKRIVLYDRMSPLVCGSYLTLSHSCRSESPRFHLDQVTGSKHSVMKGSHLMWARRT